MSCCIGAPPSSLEKELLQGVFSVTLAAAPQVTATLLTQLEAMAFVNQEHRTDVVVKTTELMKAAGEALAAFKQQHEQNAIDASVLQVGCRCTLDVR